MRWTWCGLWRRGWGLRRPRRRFGGWVSHYSLFKGEEGDAIIVGASSKEQFEETLVSLEKGPLPEDMVKAFNEGWALVKGVARPYFH